MKVILTELETKNPIGEYTQWGNINTIGYAISDPSDGPRLTLIKTFTAPYLLEEIALKWMKKDIQCDMYIEDTFARSFNAHVEKYEVRKDNDQIVEVLLMKVTHKDA